MSLGETFTKEYQSTIIRNLKTFLKHGCQKRHFTKALYVYLSNSFGFIAHYDLSSFHYERFEDSDGMMSTWTSILEAPDFNYTGKTPDKKLNTLVRDLFIDSHGWAKNRSRQVEREILLKQKKRVEERLKQLED